MVRVWPSGVVPARDRVVPPPRISAVLANSGTISFMRRQRGVALAALGIAASLMGACSLSPKSTPSPDPNPSKPTIAVPAVVADCEKPSSAPQGRPNRIVAACGGDGVFLLTHIRYSSWTAQSASGTAILKYNSCRPYCAAGHLVDAKAAFRLEDAQQLHGQLVFATVFVHSHSGPEGRYPLGGSA